MGNILTFEDILKKLDMAGERFIYSFKIWVDDNISKENYKKIKEYYIEKASAKVNNKDYNFKDLWEESFVSEETQKLEELRVIKWEAVALLATEYYNLIFNQYFITIEELSRFLNVEIKYTQTNIVENVDRLSFPPIEIKQLIKQELFFKFKENTPYDIHMKSTFKELLRKKVLLGLDTTFQYLSKHMKQEEEFEVLNIKLSKLQYKILKNKHQQWNTIKESVEKVALNYEITENDMIEFNNRQEDKLKIFVRDYFKIKTSAQEIEVYKSQENKSRFYSIAAMKVLFDKVYDIEVMRELNKLKYTKYTLVKDKDQKKPSVRYLINMNLIKEILKEIYCLKDVKKKNEDYHVCIPIQVEGWKYYSIIKNIENVEDYFTDESLKLNIKIEDEE